MAKNTEVGVGCAFAAAAEFAAVAEEEASSDVDDEEKSVDVDAAMVAVGTAPCIPWTADAGDPCLHMWGGD